MDNEQRTRLLSERKSFYLSLPADAGYATSFVSRRTHLHCVGNLDKISSFRQKLRIIPSYRRAVVIELDRSNPQHLRINEKLGSQKYSLAQGILKTNIKKLEDDAESRSTKFFFGQGQKYGLDQIHAALTPFFTLENVVQAKVRALRLY